MLKLGKITLSYERGRRVLLFLFCLFLAFVIWSVHKLSGDFSTYQNYRVHLKTQIKGKEAEALSENPLTLKIRAGGFYLLKHKFTGDWPSLYIKTEYKHLKKIPGKTGYYSLSTSFSRENIREALGETIEIETIAIDSLLFVFN